MVIENFVISILFWYNSITWILHESEAFICKALKGEVIVNYAEPLITPQMKASGSPRCFQGEN